MNFVLILGTPMPVHLDSIPLQRVSLPSKAPTKTPRLVQQKPRLDSYSSGVPVAGVKTTD